MSRGLLCIVSISQYLWEGTLLIYSLSYIVVELRTNMCHHDGPFTCLFPLISFIASNLILKKMRPSRWLPFLVAIWGTVTTLSGLVHNFSGLLAIRFFLGLCEGGLLPGIVSLRFLHISFVTPHSARTDALSEYFVQAS